MDDATEHRYDFVWLQTGDLRGVSNRVSQKDLPAQAGAAALVPPMQHTKRDPTPIG